MPAPNDRLSAVTTCWQQIQAAIDAANLPEGRLALWQLLERYGGAVERYLLGAVRNEEVAQELAQEFAVAFLKGAFKGADPNRGRFRDFVKGIIQHLIANHYRKGKKFPGHLPTALPEPAENGASQFEDDQTFIACWREELLGRTWQALLAFEERTGQPYHAVLKHKADHPDQASEQMAEAMSRQFHKAVKAPAVRKALQRAREKFADLLLDDLSTSLRGPDPEVLIQELIDLRLYEYCRPARAETGLTSRCFGRGRWTSMNSRSLCRNVRTEGTSGILRHFRSFKERRGPAHAVGADTGRPSFGRPVRSKIPARRTVRRFCHSSRTRRRRLRNGISCA